jgi:SAM-dependent methyltransferase
VDTESDSIAMRLPTRLDRYPAKMVSRLADHLIARYAMGATQLLDPFCGSGAVLVAAARAGLRVSGIDINPVGVLLSRTKLFGFDAERAKELAQDTIARAAATRRPARIDWPAKEYWFTPKTIDKFERLRAGLLRCPANDSREHTAILLCLALSVRLCSKADQRSPKPFISATARATRKGRHFDPYHTVQSILVDLAKLYGHSAAHPQSEVLLGDVVRDRSVCEGVGKCSHVITSPPYINAQDYFRNSKLELHVLEGLMPFRISEIKDRFIGTDRGALLDDVDESARALHRTLVRGLVALERREPRLSAIVHRYLHDMAKAFDLIANCLELKGTFVLVCGDNLVGGLRIRTWDVLQRMLLTRDFRIVDSFRDQIRDRMLAPKRCGHKGLIKEEVVCCYERLG